MNNKTKDLVWVEYKSDMVVEEGKYLTRFRQCIGHDFRVLRYMNTGYRSDFYDANGARYMTDDLEAICRLDAPALEEDNSTEHSLITEEIEQLSDKGLTAKHEISKLSLVDQWLVKNKSGLFASRETPKEAYDYGIKFMTVRGMPRIEAFTVMHLLINTLADCIIKDSVTATETVRTLNYESQEYCAFCTKDVMTWEILTSCPHCGHQVVSCNACKASSDESKSCDGCINGSKFEERL